MQHSECEGCRKTTPDYDSVVFVTENQQSTNLCTQCFNHQVANKFGLAQFENPNFEPVKLIDANGQQHEFHFQTRLLGSLVTLEAFELFDGFPAGYQSKVVGEPDEDLWALLGKLIIMLRELISVQYLVDSHLGVQIKAESLVGRIDPAQPYDHVTPMIVVDGREISWDELGRMMMSFEGWQFKLDIFE